MEGGGFAVTGKGSLTGAGVLIIDAPVGSSDTIYLSGQGTVILSAPASASLPTPYSSYAGIAIFQDPNSSNPITITGQQTMTVDGVVYAPRAAVDVTGNAAVTINAGAGTVPQPPIAGALIAFDLIIAGNGRLTVNPDDPSGGNPQAIVGAGGGDVHSAALAALAGGGGLAGTLTDQAAMDEIAVSLAIAAEPSGGSKPKAS
jgi:hypothetical protein